MKFTCLSSMLLVAALAQHQASAFSFSTTTTTTPKAIHSQRAFGTTTSSSSSSRLSMSSSVNDEVAKLRAAAAAARADADRLSKELGKEVESEKSTAVAVATANKASPTKSNAEIAAAIQSIDFGADALTQTMALDVLRDEGSVALYKSVTMQAGSGDLKDYPVSLKLLESRAGLTAKSLGIGVEEVNLDDFKYATLGVVGVCTVTGVSALAFLPENIGATVCYLAAVIPILFLAVGSTAPSIIANAIAGIRGSGGDDAAVSKVDRVRRHEAAHFLCGYLCGLPIASYSTGSNNKEANVPRVEFHSTRSGPLTAKQELTVEEVNALAVVALSGSVAEAMAFGSARGATSDLIELESNVFRQSKQFIGAQKQQDLTRWGALTAHRLLTQHKQKLECLVDAFAAQKSVAECVALLEQQ